MAKFNLSSVFTSEAQYSVLNLLRSLINTIDSTEIVVPGDKYTISEGFESITSNKHITTVKSGVIYKNDVGNILHLTLDTNMHFVVLTLDSTRGVSYELIESSYAVQDITIMKDSIFIRVGSLIIELVNRP